MAQPTRTLPFVQFDVFTNRRFEGNSLAIFPNASGLTDQQMQTLAREMNLSETTFIERRDPSIESDRGIKVRIFTVAEELPFAGHPTLGTAFHLRGDSKTPQITLDLKIGKVPVQFEDTPGQPAFGEMTQVDPKFGPPHDREAVVRAANLRDGDIDPALPIQTVSTGVPFTIVPTLTVTPTAGVAGRGAAVTGRGYGANETVTLTWGSSAGCCDVLAVVQTDTSGSFKLEDVPANESRGKPRKIGVERCLQGRRDQRALEEPVGRRRVNPLPRA